MKYAILPFVVTLLCGTVSSAHANKQNLRGEMFCFPAKDVPKLISELASVKSKRRNIVDVRLMPRFIIKDGGVWPERFYLAKNSEIITDLPFSRQTGEVPSFISAVIARADTDICIDDPSRAERPKDDEGLYFEMGLSPLFNITSGQHEISELEEAARDGKVFYKKMLPDVLSIFMPDTDYFAISMTDRQAMPTTSMLVDGMEKALDVIAFKDMWVFSLDDIEDMGANQVLIRGGAYDLKPVPSPKIMRKFGIGDAVNAE